MAFTGEKELKAVNDGWQLVREREIIDNST
jgi:hypothetical protein